MAKQEIFGTSNKVLEIDLSTETSATYNVTQQERRMYLGGKGLGLKLIFDRMKPGTDPLGPDNIIAIMPGVLMGTGAACSGRFASVTKSPLTGIMVSSSCGGPFGMQLKTAGWDGALIKGRAKKPTTLVIKSTGVEFRDASELWGKDVGETQQALGKVGGSLVIGPAGESQVRFACIVAGERFVGRAGQGAVMGSKNLKAIIAIGNEYKIVPCKLKEFEKAKRKGLKFIDQNEVTSDWYRNHGTPANVNLCNKGGILPVKNFTQGMSPDAWKISGEEMRAKHATKPHTCKPCSILCGKQGTFAGAQLVTPEYETVALFGSNLGIFDPVKIARWNRLCTEKGMDTISAGNVIGWTMEATEKGLVKSDLRFGNSDRIDDAINDMAQLRGLGKDMALGVRAMAEKYGGAGFAMQVKGLELPGYDPRGAFGHGLSYAVANRGACHLSTSIFAMEVFFGLLKPYRTRAKPNFVKFFEDLYCCINSLHGCQFTAFAYLLEPALTKYTPKPLLGFLMQNIPEVTVSLVDFSLYRKLWASIVGCEISNSDYLLAGSRIHVLERYMNTREGVSRKDDTLPQRLLEEGRECDPKKRPVPLAEMLDKYYALRGYDNNGIPTEATLKRLGIMAT